MKLFPIVIAALAAAVSALAAPSEPKNPYVEVTYAPSKTPGELQFGVTYTAWIPDGVKRIRGVIVHQHGCGSGACKGGETAAYDLHWQELARRWDCALLGPSYHQKDGEDCRLWCDPRNGSEKTFLRALDDLAAKSGHPELASAPWCLWGHSGGGFWASLMQASHPERIVAIWFRSGTAFSTWESGQIRKPEIPDAAMQIPMVCNPGARENGDPRFSGAWTGTMAMFKAYRAKGAPIAFAPDPRTAHECGDSRYLSIPFFDRCLALRLPDRAGRPLKKLNLDSGYLASLLGTTASPAREFEGNKTEASWLPDRRVADAWSQYVQTGAVTDSTPPEAPTNVTATSANGAVRLTWSSRADFESGLSGFVVERDGAELAALPQKPVGRFGRPLYQPMSYHDTPERPLPEMTLVDPNPGLEKHTYRVIAVNSVGLRSKPSKPAVP